MVSFEKSTKNMKQIIMQIWIMEYLTQKMRNL